MNEDHLRYLDGLRNGNQQVFRELFNAYYEPLCRYCMRVIPDQDEAEEIVQDVFVNLWSKRTELGIDTSLNAYLYRMVMNKAINFNNHMKIRMKHQEQVRAHSSEAAPTSDGLMEAELQSLFETALAGMPEKRREVFLMSRKQGLKYPEIASKLNVSEKTVEAHISKALEDLRLQLREYLPAILIAAAFSLTNTASVVIACVNSYV